MITISTSSVISNLYLNIDLTYADSKIVLSIPNPSINLDVLSISSAGNFKSSSNMAINVSTDYYAGYTLGIAAKTSNGNSLVNQDDNTKTITSINSLVSEANYQDDTYATTNHLNNTWGIRPDTLYNSSSSLNESNTNYLPISSDISEQIVIAHTTSNSNNDNYNISIGTRIDANIPAGVYQNTFVVTAVANPAPYSITYNQNTEDTVTNMPTPNPDTGTTYDGSVNISNNIPQRDGYTFKGWCSVAVADNATCDSPNIQYDSGDNITTTSSQLTFYAVWADTLWKKVEREWAAGGSRVQTNDTDPDTGIKAAITTDNSGVFKYDSDVFGTASDMNNNYDIYYFRGILDSNLDGTSATYGSNGDGVTWPNYVKLGDTCWRIVRTTGSGGVKMIYNGSYSGGTTAGSCANTTNNTRLAFKSFNSTDIISSRNIIAVGYTFNDDYKTTEADTKYGDLFGTNIDYSGNDTDSTIKDYVENTWFSGINGVSAYEPILEPNAGYCNDRSISGVGDNDNISAPYATTSSVTMYYFSADRRNSSTAQPPSLTCPRDEVDVYTISNIDENDNVETYGGNGQLKKPAALLTADELSFAGSGNSTASWGSSYHANSYLCSGSVFWSLSPRLRNSNMYVYGLALTSNGYLNEGIISGTYGVRPVISLIHSTAISSGIGTAVDPFIISPPTP